MSTTVIPEIDVIIGTSLYLYENEWAIKSISIPTGQGLDAYLQKKKLLESFSGEGIPTPAIVFSANGPDIVARQGDKIWKIECKGLGTGKSPTLRNNFDRALSSAASYYDDVENTYVGLALPLDQAYVHHIKYRIPSALRVAISLWIFLYEPNGGSVWAIAPGGHDGSLT